MILAKFIDEYSTDPRFQLHWDCSLIRLFELQSYLELCMLTKTFLKNVKTLKEGYDTTLLHLEETDTEYVLGARLPDFEEWEKVLRSLFCFPTGRRTYKSIIHAIDHFQRSYSRRVKLLQKGFRIHLDAQIDLRFRTSWHFLNDLHIDVRGRHIIGNNLHHEPRDN